MLPSHDSSRNVLAPEEEVVAAVLRGQRDEFRILYERHRPALLRYLTAQTGDPALAEDLTQETFLAAFEHLRDLEEGQSFEPWLYRIAQHRLRRAWKKRLRRLVSLEAWPASVGLVAPGLARSDDLADRCGERDAIQGAIDELSPALRAAFLLHDLEGRPAREIAVVLGISRVAAERQVSRARAAFRARYLALAAAGREGAAPR